MEKVIKIACRGADVLPYTAMAPIQGAFKELTRESYEKLKLEILTQGFSEPITLWQDPNREPTSTEAIAILNGTQRWRTVKEMVENEGYQCPPLPVSWTEAPTLELAARKIVGLASQYGKVVPDGLYELMSRFNIQLEDIRDRCQFPEVNFKIFEAEFFKDLPEIAPTAPPESYDQTDATDLPDSQVKMIQLYLSMDQHALFSSWLESLKPHFQADNNTDTILRAVQFAVESLVTKADAETLSH